jgi:hypothetical protein
MEFFQSTDASEGLYSKIADAPNRYLRKARRLTERMWATCGQYVDADAPDRARTDDFCPVWWELYIAYALSRAGILFVPRKDRPSRRGFGCPDLLSEHPRIWIEAVMPRAGTGADALSEPPAEGAFDIPLDNFILRLATVIEDKAATLERYIKEGTISGTDATVIAVSGGRLPFHFQEYAIPNIVRTVFGVGFLALELDIEKGKSVGTHVEFRDHIKKKSTAAVSTTFFLKEESAHVSAVLYSSSNFVDYPRRPGAEFILVHNPHASVPLVDTWLPWDANTGLKATNYCPALPFRAFIGCGKVRPSSTPHLFWRGRFAWTRRGEAFTAV